MRWYRVCLEIKEKYSGRVRIVSFTDYSYSLQSAIDSAVDYSIQSLFYDVLNVLSAYEVK